MKLQVFSVLDKKAAAFANPHFMPTKGLMLRSFGDESARPESMLCRHPEDYDLYKLAEWDSDSGKFVNCERPEFLASALDFVVGKDVSDGSKID